MVVVGQYPWGAVALVFLFRGLSKAIRPGHQHLSGSITRLLCWAYKHLNLLCQIPKEIRAGQLRSLKWVPPKEWDNSHNFHLVLRQETDNARINDVIWTLYNDYPDHGNETEEDKDYDIIVRQTALCHIYLICGHICEGYMPDRVLWQFQLHQWISADPSQWERRERRARLVHEGYNPRNWDVIGEALHLLKIYDPKATREEDAYEELDLDDDVEDVQQLWLPSPPDEGPSNTQPIPTLVQPEEPR
ncbi:hypothetical protein AMTR_s00027p00193830 [Amborella trichopoda]|uniref:Aminotransferase-like plant mobile domain-containing protein n=1 Tax=Amborella trichopoda TaxID=13333 RepID=W1PSE8_AMBTC|nr:hypothetical protein AMTR_s00027p00193830 [Amborella trichopoda]